LIAYNAAAAIAYIVAGFFVLMFNTSSNTGFAELLSSIVFAAVLKVNLRHAQKEELPNPCGFGSFLEQDTGVE
jgi:hypothetical protein